MQEDVAPYFYELAGSPPDWTELYTRLNQKYGNRAGELVSYVRMIFFKENGMQDSLLASIPDYMNSYVSHLQPELLNSIVWTIFEISTNNALLQQAAGWCKTILDEENNALYIDTYANLLYKSGQKEEAIVWEQKAVDKAGDSIQGLKENLDKMKNGEKTWQDQ